MLRKIWINWTKWVDWFDLENQEIKNILNKYDVHELDLEACLEWNQKSRIDDYDNYSFIVFHFPKYNTVSKIYELNEFNIFFWKDFLLTLRDFPITNIDKIYDYYKDIKVNNLTNTIKFTPGYILYEITQVMLEKMFRVIKNISLDIKDIEKQVFEKPNSSFVKDIMIKKRNIVVLMHMFKPQIYVLRQLENVVNKYYSDKIEVYFEDLEDKMEQIVNDLNVLWEHIDTVEDAFKSIIDIRTNKIMTFLALFSAIMLPMTFITSFYWMNVKLPYQDNIEFVYIFLLTSLFIMMAIYFYFRRNSKI